MKLTTEHEVKRLIQFAVDADGAEYLCDNSWVPRPDQVIGFDLHLSQPIEFDCPKHSSGNPDRRFSTCTRSTL
jgi:hypothetical protein